MMQVEWNQNIVCDGNVLIFIWKHACFLVCLLVKMSKNIEWVEPNKHKATKTVRWNFWHKKWILIKDVRYAETLEGKNQLPTKSVGRQVYVCCGR